MDNLLHKLQNPKRKEPDLPPRREVPVVEAEPDTGLTEQQAKERLDAGWANTPVEGAGKTTREIIFSNVFTYFNILFFLLALCVIAVSFVEPKLLLNLTFMGVIIINTVIGIVQELRSKKTLEELSVLTAPKATVVREGQERTVGTELVVRDDIVILGAGNQIYADAVVVAGECYVNEALITGESDEIHKLPGDPLLSGSMAAREIAAAEEQGLVAYLKHFAQE